MPGYLIESATLFLCVLFYTKGLHFKKGKIVTPINSEQQQNIPSFPQNNLPLVETSTFYVTIPYIASSPGYTVSDPSTKIVVPTTNTPPNQISVAELKCQEMIIHSARKRQVTPYVVGGEQTLNAEFPHMAALGYGNEPNIMWLCGGSLISEQWVVTAAHCVQSQQLGPVNWVRLGDFNLKSPDDDGNVQQFTVTSRIIHTGYIYPSLYDDIALLQLDHPAIITTYVKPICLYTHGEPLSDTVLVATGWGKTQYQGSVSDTLMKVSLEMFSTSRCRDTYYNVASSQLSHGVDGRTQICAGSFTNPRDTCTGDSGGPLHTQRDGMYYLIGITSFGLACGIPNKPAVYTRVQHYLPWIENIVWPNYLGNYY